jgi:hypothetical protein
VGVILDAGVGTSYGSFNIEKQRQKCPDSMEYDVVHKYVSIVISPARPLDSCRRLFIRRGHTSTRTIAGRHVSPMTHTRRSCWELFKDRYSLTGLFHSA